MPVVTDPISDFLTRLKNASRAAKEEMTAPFSRIKAEIARILQEEGYVWSYEVVPNDGKPRIKVKLNVAAGPSETHRTHRHRIGRMRMGRNLRGARP